MSADETALRAEANRLLLDMAADARGDEPHLPLPPLPDGYLQGFEDGYVEGRRSAPPAAAVEGWRDPDDAPHDENVLIRAEPDWVGEARLDLVQEEGNERVEWVWANTRGKGRVLSRVTGWMPLPAYDAPPAAPRLQWEAVAGAIREERPRFKAFPEGYEARKSACDEISRRIAALLPEPQRAKFVKAAGGGS